MYSSQETEGKEEEKRKRERERERAGHELSRELTTTTEGKGNCHWEKPIALFPIPPW